MPYSVHFVKFLLASGAHRGYVGGMYIEEQLNVKTGSEKNFPAIRDYLFTEGSEKNAGAYTRFLPGILVEGDTVTAPCRENLAQKFNSL